jgi:hypothetical protein
MAFGSLTWVGFMIVAFGWAVLFSAAPLVDILANLTGRSPGALSNLPVIAECTIITGFGLGIVGALKTGFGALQNFFDAILERTARSAAQLPSQEPGAAVPAKEPVAVRREPHAAKPTKIVERGRLKDRAYVLFGDGSVEVETLLGLRRFASVGEACDFIG